MELVKLVVVIIVTICSLAYATGGVSFIFTLYTGRPKRLNS